MRKPTDFVGDERGADSNVVRHQLLYDFDWWTMRSTRIKRSQMLVSTWWSIADFILTSDSGHNLEISRRSKVCLVEHW